MFYFTSSTEHESFIRWYTNFVYGIRSLASRNATDFLIHIKHTNHTGLPVSVLQKKKNVKMKKLHLLRNYTSKISTWREREREREGEKEREKYIYIKQELVGVGV